MTQITVYNPVGEVETLAQSERQIGERLGSLANKVIGFIDDMKPNAGTFLKLIEQSIKEEYPVSATHTVRKTLTSNMAAAQDLDSSVQGAVVAWGD